MKSCTAILFVLLAIFSENSAIAQQSWAFEIRPASNSVLYRGATLIEGEDGVSLFYQNIAHEISYFGEAEKTKHIETQQIGNFPLAFFADKIGDEFIVFHLKSGTSNNQNILASHLDKDFLLQGDIFEIPENTSGSQGRVGLSAIKKSNGNYLVFGEAFISEIEFLPQSGFSVVSQIAASYDVESVASLNGKIYCKQGASLFELNQDLSISWEKDLSSTYTSISKIGNIGGSLFIQGQSSPGTYQCTKYDNSGIEIFTFSKQGFLGSHIIDDGQSYLIAEEDNSAQAILRLNLQGEEVESFDFTTARISGLWKSSKGGYFLVSNNTFFNVHNWGDILVETSQHRKVLRSQDMFLPLQSAGNVSTFTTENFATTIFAGNLWAGGIDENGNTLVHAPNYWMNDYTAGPSTIDSDIFDRVWKVTSDQIQLVRTDMADGTKDEAWPYSIRSWPAKGNPQFFHEGQIVNIQEELAPFVDVDDDGIYNVLNGDYPALKGDEMLYSIQHSSGPNTHIPSDFQTFMYRFKNAQNPALRRTIFLEMDMKNNGQTDFDEFHMGYWVDADLGCYSDDFVGSLPSKNTVYIYNQDEIDGNIGADCLGIPTYGTEPPIQTISFIEDSLYSFIAYNNPTVGQPNPNTSDPTQPIEYLNYLQGKWRDGSSISIGGNGYDPSSSDVTRYLYSGNPANTNDWTACTANESYHDKRILLSKFPEPFAVGDKITLKLAFTLHDSPNLPCPDIDEIVDDLDEVKQTHGILTDVEDVNSLTQLEPSILLYPNPSSASFLIKSEEVDVENMRVFDMQGRLVLERKVQPETPVSVEHLSNGCYFIELSTSKGRVYKKLAVLR